MRLRSNSKTWPISKAWLDAQAQQQQSRAASAADPRRRRPLWPPAPDLTAQLQQLAQLHTAGVLSDEEFAAAKQKLLAG